MVSEESRRSVARSPRDRALRYLGLFVGLLVGWQIGQELASIQEVENESLYATVFAASMAGILFIITPYITIGFFSWLRRKVVSIPAIDVVSIGVGLIIGGLLGSLFALPVALLPDPYGQILPFIIAVIVCAASVSIVVLRRDDLVPLFMRRNGETRPEDRLLLDTSVIIDGRIVDLVRTHIVNFPLVVPRFILRELQGIANADDPSRKVRGRRGLDVLERLQREGIARVEILEVEVDEEPEVDNKLIRLAKLSRYLILTGDQNLERVARLQDVIAININSVAQALRPPVAPGEELELDIVQPGREFGQGIGYLDDGTLIVVEEGRERIGKHVRVVVTRTLQTGTGRMAFAQVKEEAPV